jgi:hypothetical protein
MAGNSAATARTAIRKSRQVAQGSVFPSTSTVKTTIHDIEIVAAPAPWKAIVTFAGLDEVREYLSECVSSPVLAAWRRAPDSKVLRRHLNHVYQRFRFSYVLGNGPQFRVADFDDADEEEDAESPADLLDKDGSKPIDLRQTNQIPSKTLTALKGIAKRHGDELRAKLGAVTASDERAIDELFEEDFDDLIRDDEQFHSIVDDLIDVGQNECVASCALRSHKACVPRFRRILMTTRRRCLVHCR